MDDHGRLVDVGDTQLFVARHGCGIPVVVLHGGMGLDHTYLRPWLDPLASVAQLVYFDQRGNGRSGDRDDLDAVSMSTWADDVERLRQALGLTDIVLFGHSYGGFVALEYALRHLDQLAGLILCGTTATFDHWDLVHAALDARRATVAQRRGFAQEPFADDEEFATWLRAAWPLYFHRFDEAAAQLTAANVLVNAAAVRRGGACLDRWDVQQGLPHISVPTLVLGGRHDFIMPPAHTTDRLAAALPAATSVVFEHSGHLPFAEEPDRFQAVVGDWLRSVAGTPRSPSCTALPRRTGDAGSGSASKEALSS